jgi:hypothetical protein
MVCKLKDANVCLPHDERARETDLFDAFMLAHLAFVHDAEKIPKENPSRINFALRDFGMRKCSIGTRIRRVRT